MRKILLILTALVMSVAVFAQKITTPGGITSGNKYYIGATTGGNDFYFYVDGSAKTASIKGIAKEDVADAVALTFTAVTGGWTIQFENGLYLGIKNAKDNGAVQVVEDAVVWTIDEDNGLLKLHPNDYYLQKNNGNTQFGSFKNTQTNVWLESAGGATPVSAILESIVIKGAATKMAYEVGEAFDPAGLEVWGLYTKYVKNDSTSQITSGITWSIDPETFTTVSGNASVTLSASYKDKTSSDTTITGINVSNPAPIDYLCFTADSTNSTIELENSGSPTPVTIQYQVNGTAADGWTSVDFSTATTTSQITLDNVGDKVYFRNASSEVTGFSTDASNYYHFVMTGSIAASGNVMSLVDKSCQTLTIPGNHCFYKLFYGCTSLTAAPALPATTLTTYCYRNMFYGCTSLTAAPALPATTLADDCYEFMFSNCTSLTTAPALPATTLTDKCYQNMFAGCYSLTTAPALPATTLADNCYEFMFSNCYSLTTAPALPATTLAANCYKNMFDGCSSLTTAPALPATTLADNCYGFMFAGCTSLTTAPALPATTLTNNCYTGMFAACSTLVVNTTGPGVEWSIPAGATGSSNATSNMFYGTGGDFTGAPAPGTTYYIASMSYLCFTADSTNSTIELEKSGSPTPVTIQYQVNGTAADGWTSVDFSTATTTGQITLANVGDKVYFRNASNEVTGFSTSGSNYYHFAMTGSIAASGNVMSLVDKSCQTLTIPCNFCFTKLFQGCASLTTAPALPATTLTDNCYQYMFSRCSSLTAAPELPATIMATCCYRNMFEYCDSLTAAPALPATTLATYCYSNMFYKCYTLMTAPTLPATTLADNCYQYMFFGCDSLTTAPALPATTLAANCYGYMFANCASLTTAPALPATTLTDNCYQSMFSECASLTTAPALPATTLTDKCYQYMFYGCTSLTTAPALPATTLADKCYEFMFVECSTLVVNTTGPGVEWSIPAGATGGSIATSYMFYGTGGDFTGAPVPGTTYYIYSATIPGLEQIIADSVAGKAAGATVTIDLNAGEEYPLNGLADAGLVNLVINGNGAKVTLADSTQIAGQQRIEINNVNFDCAANTKLAPIALSAAPDSAVHASKGNFYGNTQNVFVDTCAIVLNGCNFAQLSTSLFSNNAAAWVLGSLTINNCVVQFSKSNTKPYIDFESAPNNVGAIKNFTINASTLFNISIDDAYFIRFANASNGQASKAFPSDPHEYITFTNNTFVNICTKKNFGNNTQNNNGFVDEVKGNVFFNTYRLNKYFQTNNTFNFTVADNAINGNIVTIDGTDKSKIATEDTALVLTLPTGAFDFNVEALAANFTPSATSYAGQNSFGDPRFARKPAPMVWDFTTITASVTDGTGNLKGTIVDDGGTSWSNHQNNAAITDAELTVSEGVPYALTKGLKFTASGSGWIHIRNYPEANFGKQLFSNNKDLMMTVPVKAGQYVIFTALSAKGAITLKAIEGTDTTAMMLCGHDKYIYRSKAGDVKFNLVKQMTIKKIEVVDAMPKGLWSFATITASDADGTGNLKNNIVEDGGAGWTNHQNNKAITDEELTISEGVPYAVTKGLKFTAGGSGWIHIRNYPEANGGKQFFSNNKDLKVRVPAKAGQYVIFDAYSASGTTQIVLGEDTVNVYLGGYTGHMIQAKEDNPVFNVKKQVTIKNIYVVDAVPYQLAANLKASVASAIVKVGDKQSITWSSDNVATPLFATDNAEVAKVDSKGNITAVSAGEATITVSQPANAYFKEATVTIKVTVENADSTELAAAITEAIAGKIAGDTATVTLDGKVAYTFEKPADVGLVNLVINGNGAVVTLSDSVQIATQASLIINDVNFDCAANTKLAPIALSANPDSSLVGTNFQTEGTALRGNAFYNAGTITLSNCNFSEVKTSLVSANKREWNLKNLTIKNCIVQFDVASGIESYINWYGNSKNEGSIKEIVIEGSTLYNIVENNNNYFLRYANNSNSQPQKAWPEPQFDGKCSWTMTNNTIVNLPSNKDFANNYPNKNPICEFTWKGNIFYNTTLLRKAIQSNVAKFSADDNAIIGITKAVDATDNQKYATIDSLLIQGDNRMTTPTTALDFTKIDSLVNNFAPATTSYAGKNGFGDPRWAPSPNLTELSYFVAQAIEEAGDADVVYNLDPAVEYTLSTPVVTGTKKVTINGGGRTLVVDSIGQFRIKEDLILNDINFDCAASALPLIALDTMKAAADTVYCWNKYGANGKDAFFMENIKLNNVNVSGLSTSLIKSEAPWAIRNVSIMNSIVQMNQANKFFTINLQDGGNGMIQNLDVEKSTLYNIVADKGVFIAYNANNPGKKFWGEEDANSTWVMKRNTFANIYGDKMGDRYTEQKTNTINWTGNIFYAVGNLSKIRNCTVVSTPADNTTGGTNCGNNTGYATVDSTLVFTVPETNLDLANIDLKANFAPSTTSYAGSHGFGDPRWVSMSTITANVNDTAMGSVTGAGEYAIGAEVTLTATAKEGYRFSNWTNANTGDTLSTENPWTITVTQDSTIVANFVINNLFTITLNVNDEAMGSVEGAGIYTRGDVAVVTAIPAEHHHFVHWNNGSLDPTTNVFVIMDTTLTATFAIDQHVVRTDVNNNTLGTVAGAGAYNYGATATLTATPAAHAVFTGWSNGETDATITITVAGDTTVTAMFAADTHTIAATANDAAMGSVTGAGEYVHGTLATLTAVANEHYHFTGWSNGLTANTFSILVDKDSTVTANFAIDQHVVKVNANDNALGTVAGAGTYNYGEEVTLTATAAAHGVFTGWSNGATTPTINITVAGDTTVTANFIADSHVIAANADPAMGSVTGAGTYTHGTLATLTAVANEHYHFTGWSNGLTANTFSILVENDSTVTANFAIDQHVVTVNANDNALGTVAGAGTYNYGAQVTLTATAAAHGVFTGWSNGATTPTINITVAGDTTVTANFIADSHVIAANADPAMGSVTGAGTYTHGTLATLTAVANEHYHFTGWSNGLTANTFSILVENDSTVTANFAIDQHVVTANVNNNALGTVSGAGTYNYGASVTLTATAAAHGVFTGWSNGATTPTINITVAGDTTVTAMFAADTHTIAANVNSTTMGSVTGAGEYVHGTLATLTAVANVHYHFVNWSNGLTANTFSILVDKDSTVTANFAIDQHVVKVNANDNALGTVAGAGTYNYGATATLTATPAAHSVFTGWSNGATANPYTFTLTGDMNITANFTVDSHVIAANVNNAAMGTVAGAGTYTHGALATLTATPNAHHHFVNWSNGLTANSFSILVDRDSTVTANFAIDQHNVSAIVNNQVMGTVEGTGLYNYGATATLTAVPAAHYHFVRWNTGKTNVNQTVNVTSDITFIATFAIDQHNATILSSDESLGIVSGSGLYNYGSQVAINAIPNHRGVSFTGWSNGLTTPTAVIDLTKDTVITASFVLNHYDIILNVNDETMGSVAGAGTYIYGDEVTITATAADDCHSFVRWSDGETAATRTITVDDNVTLTAIFAIDQYTISVASSDNAGGVAYCDKSGAEVSSMTVACGTMVDIYAEANQYYHFVEWSDGVTDDMRSIEVNGDINLVAIFAPNCGENADLPVVFLYNGLVMLDLDSVKERGYDPKPSQVKWYQVVGDVDNIEASFPADDQYVCEGYYLSLPTNNVGYGQYYAVVDVSNSPAALCHDKMKTVVVEYTNTNSQQNVQMAPTRVKSGEVITITGLVPDEKTTITVYDYTGKSVDVMQTEGLATYDFTSYGVTGVYMVKVTSDSVNETFKFIVSK